MPNRWQRATIISIVFTIAMFVVMLSLTIATVHESIAVKHAIQTAVGTTPPKPDTLDLALPAPPPRGHDLQPEFARFAADLVLRLGAREEPVPPPTLAPMGTFSSSFGKRNGWMLQAPDQLWVVFRGTCTRDEWNKDFEMQQAPFLARLLSKNIRKMTYPKLSQAPQTPHADLPEARVHSGFLAVYLDVRDLLLEAVGRSEHARVCVTGHSLGGALAQFAAYDIALHHPDKLVDTVVFGCPRVGNAAFADAMAGALNSFVALNNTCDIVPDLPLAVQPRLGAEQPLLYVHPRGAHNFTDNRHTWTANHMMGVYIDHIDTKIGAL
jgi:hypothetical protein